MVSFDELVTHIDRPGVDADPAEDIIRLHPEISQDEALAVQIAVKRRRVAAGDRLAGYQASFTSAGVRRSFPTAPSPMVGSLLASLIRPSGSRVALGKDRTVLECEVGAILKRDLEGPDLSDQEILAAIEGFCPAIEVAPVRPGVMDGAYSWPHMIAVQKSTDGGYVVLGSRLTSPTALDIRLEGCLISIDGIARAGAIGFEAMGSPLRVIAGIAERLHRVGGKLLAGQLVITGSLPPPQPVEASCQSAMVEFTTLGPVSVAFER